MDKIQIIEKLFYYIVTYSYLLLPLCFIWCGNKKKDLIPIVLALYGIICFFFLEYYDTFPKEIRKYLKTFYTFFEYSIFTIVIWYSLKSKKARQFILIASLAFLGFQLIYLFSGKVKRLDTVPVGIETILLITYVVYFFYQYYKTISTSYIYNHYIFWIAVGILIYLGGSFFFYILINHLSEDQINTFGTLTYLAEIIKNILFVIALVVYVKFPVEKNEKKQSHIPYLDMI